MDDFRRTQKIGQTAGCGPRCCGKAPAPQKTARARLRREDRTMEHFYMIEHYENEKNACGVCGEVNDPRCRLEC